MEGPGQSVQVGPPHRDDDGGRRKTADGHDKEKGRRNSKLVAVLHRVKVRAKGNMRPAANA